MLKTATLTFLIALVLTIVTTYFYLGGNKKASFEYTDFSRHYIYYKETLGSYNQTSFVIEEVEKKLVCEETFALFFDSPEKVKESDLRSWLGCIYNEPLKEVPEGIKQGILGPAKNILMAKFDGSPVLGPIKVYQKVIEQHLVPNTFPSLEIYSFDKERRLSTKYLFNLQIAQ